MPANVIPVELKKALGNPGQRKLPEAEITIAPLEEIPPVPAGLSHKAQDYWQNLWLATGRFQVPQINYSVVERYCRLLDEFDEATELDTRLKVSKHLMELEKHMCISPKERSQLGVLQIAEVAKKVDLLDNAERRGLHF